MNNKIENNMERGWISASETNKRIYQLWRNIIMRCYDSKYLEKCPSYKNVYMCERWFKLSNFVDDIKKIENYDLWLKNEEKYDLDKDILCEQLKIENKIYSPETCKFVTHQENCIQRSNENIITEETRKKLSILKSGENHPMFGKHHSEETIQKMSEIRSGENHPMFGKHHSEETRKKISNSLKGKYTGEKSAMFGKHLSEETKEKISKIHKGKKISLEARQKMSETRSGENHPMFGKHHSEETRNKLSESLKGKGSIEIIMVDLNNNIKIFESAVKAAEYLSQELNCKVYSSNITKTCSYYKNPEEFIEKYGKAQKTYKGFKFYYKDDYNI